MKLRKIGVVLLALLLAGMVMVPMVSADLGIDKNVPVTSLNAPGTDKSVWKGVGGMELTKVGVFSTGSLSAKATRSQYQWTAGSDIWNPVIGVKSTHYSYSRMNNAPYDIDTIGVRGRVWKENNLMFDQPQTSTNGADATVNYDSGSTPITGRWFERSNHVFENSATSDYWYPVTEDHVNC